MARYADRVKFTTASTGTGSVTGFSAVTNFRSPAGNVTDGKEYRAVLEGPAGWEVSTAVFSGSGATMARTLRISSTGSLLNLSGTTTISLDAVAEDFSSPEWTETVPSAPLDGLKGYARKFVGNARPGWINAEGLISSSQIHLGRNRAAIIYPLGNGTTIQQLGTLAATATGTATTRNVGSSSLLSMMQRIGYVPASAATNTAVGYSTNTGQWLRGGSAKVGGFHCVLLFGWNAWTTGNRCFFGMNNIGVPTGSSTILSQVSCIGFGCDQGDTTFKSVTNDASGNATMTDTSMTIEADKLYSVEVFCKANDSKVIVGLYNLTDDLVYEETVTTNLPTATTIMRAVLAGSTGNVTTGAALDFCGLFIEKEL